MIAKVHRCDTPGCSAPVGSSGAATVGWCQGDPPHWNDGKHRTRGEHANRDPGRGVITCFICGLPLRDHSVLRPCARDRYPDEPVRRCSSCGDIKPASDYSPRRGACKQCRNADARNGRKTTAPA